MITGEKILITGVGGVAALPIARALARENEVWGVARFRQAHDPTATEMSASGAITSRSVGRQAVDALGVTTRPLDLERPDFSDIPDDFTYVLHFAWSRDGADQFDRSIRVNAEGAGFVLQHCRKARAALVISSASVYSPVNDPFHAYKETDPIGRSLCPVGPTRPSSKVAQEAVARFCARAFRLPLTIARLHTVYGESGGLPARHIGAVLAGEEITVYSNPEAHSPIHSTDMILQLEALLDAAHPDGPIVNWAGDEVVTSQHWCATAAELARTQARLNTVSVENMPPGAVADTTRRRSITGPCTVKFDQAFSEMFDRLSS